MTNPGSSWKPLNQEKEQTRSPSKNYLSFSFSLFFKEVKTCSTLQLFVFK